ncbi:hypothetical protein AKJ09_01737 [Labilithrix luteola]|uniref:Uncharacterized protein n=1 Tax=Labilithrix luteola TaxID=1391654 RepID=A0A0K1PNG9_9BACT|nr:outer membrane protein assembly factor BamD [Labilithrix luteola]AKU95073.1 hypothetical protein AKJ09_01737 [Labilithrix luteola]
MTPPDSERLIRGSTNDMTRTLLESAKGDAPDPHARSHMLAALASAPAAPETVGLVRRFARPGGNYVYAIGALLVLSAGATLTVATTSNSSSPPGQVTTSTPSTTPAAPESVEETSASASAGPVVTPDALPSAPVADVETAPKVISAKRAKLVEAVPKGAANDNASTLAREIAAVEAARTALASGDPSRALALLAEYDREFPTGAFAVEVSVLRIEALARAGRIDEARALGARFLALHPHGAFARRVALTLGRSNAPPTSAVAPDARGD